MRNSDDCGGSAGISAWHMPALYSDIWVVRLHEQYMNNPTMSSMTTFVVGYPSPISDGVRKPMKNPIGRCNSRVFGRHSNQCMSSTARLLFSFSTRFPCLCNDLAGRATSVPGMGLPRSIMPSYSGHQPHVSRAFVRLNIVCRETD